MRWNMIGARVESDEPAPPKGVHVMAPTRDYAIDDTWHVLGLRGSAARTSCSTTYSCPRTAP